MIVPLLVVIATAVVYIAYLLGEIRDELQAIDRHIPAVNLSSLDSVETTLNEIEKIMREQR